jgi:large subunit ribosomal protein L10
VSREKKGQQIDQLSEVIARCTVAVITDYRGLNALEMTDLRNRLRNSGVEFKVVKNTLARLATDKAGKGALTGVLEGPVAIAFGYGEITEPAKVLAEYLRVERDSALSIKGGFLGERLISADDVNTLSTLPPREVLLAKLLGAMQGPMVGLVSHLSRLISGLARVLQARVEQMEAAGSNGKQ